MKKAKFRLITGIALCGGILAAAAAIAGLSGGGNEKKNAASAAPLAAFSASRNLNVTKAMNWEPVANYKPHNAPLIDKVPPISDARQDLNQNFGAGNAGLETQIRGILNGYKGYRYRRPGYKSAGDGWWYPAAAFPKRAVTEQFMQKPAVIARSPEEKSKPAKAKPEVKKAKPRPRKRAASYAALIAEHKQWCAAHHASYNPDTNNYREGFGQKRQCVSPYFH